ncbi:hypothetical protein V6Z11_D09G059700 [Gossypium hirsutum]
MKRKRCQLHHILHHILTFSSFALPNANHLRLKTSIDVVRWLSFQGCTFRGHNQSSGSKNRGNFLALLSLLASYDKKDEDILKSVLQNASYTSSTIQKEILQFYAIRVHNVIHEEIVHVQDTTSLTLKNVNFNVLLQHSFDIQNIRGQCYDGASNMRGKFNGLQPVQPRFHHGYEIYIAQSSIYHKSWISSVWAHKPIEPTRSISALHGPLQPKPMKMLMEAPTVYRPLFAGLAYHTSDCTLVWSQMSYFGFRRSTVKVGWLHTDVICGFPSEVVEVHEFFKDLSDVVNIPSTSSKWHDELQKTQAVEITRLVSINELATITGMNQIDTLQHPGETRWSSHLNSVEVLGVTNKLCQALQHCSQDILNAMSLLREDGWNELLKNVICFRETWELDFPNMNAQYIVVVVATRRKIKFNEHVVELLTLTTSLDPKEFFKLFDIDKICILHYKLDVCKHPNLRKILTLSELRRSLVESGRSIMYPLIDRLICLILTLPVSTASSERMKDDFLRSSLAVYIEKEIAKKFDVNEIIDDFSLHGFNELHGLDTWPYDSNLQGLSLSHGVTPLTRIRHRNRVTEYYQKIVT